MKFWEDNRLDREYELSTDEIVERFCRSEQYDNWQAGWPLDRALRVFMSDRLGTWEDLEEYEEVFGAVMDRDRSGG